MTELTHVSLFSGIGGIDLAAEWAGFKTILFVEKNDYCQKVLRKHWPGVPIIGDIRDVKKEKIMAYSINGGCHERWPKSYEQDIQIGHENIRPETAEFREGGDGITLISGGFPCQPHSIAGKREGSTDERNLWPEFRRVIGEIKPRWVLAENVPGIFSSDAGRFFGIILADLAEMGYSAGWATYGAVDVGALHRRNRVFVVAHAIGRGEQQQKGDIGEGRRWAGNGGQDVPDTEEQGLQVGIPHTRSSKEEIVRPQQADWWAVEPELGRVAHGIPHRVDRLRALGNAVVPQQIFPILKTIAMLQRGAL